MGQQPPIDGSSPQQAHPQAAAGNGAGAAPAAPPAPGPSATVDEVLRPRVYLGFWRDPAVQNWLPFATSVLLHAGLLLVGIFTYQATVQFVTKTREQIIIPEAAIVEGGEVGGIPHPGLGGDPNRDAAQGDLDTPANEGGWAERSGEAVASSLMGSGASEESGESVIGLGSGAGFGQGMRVGGGTGDGTGPLAPFGVPGGGGGAGPKSPFMGISGNALRVVYVCDSSGSMMTHFDFLQAELRRAVDVLRPIQAFNIVFFRDEKASAFSDTGLLRATAETKRKAFSFIVDARAYGTTAATPAVELAFAQKPQLMYVLTDGFDLGGESERGIIDVFRRLNRDKAVKVNTIMIKTHEDPRLEDVMRTIASENGGTCKIVAEKDMGQ